MRTSLNEIKQIEEHLFRKESSPDSLLMEVRLLLDDELSRKVDLQRQTYRLIKSYGRKKLKEEIAALDQQLFQAAKHQSFRDKIRRIFSNP